MVKSLHCVISGKVQGVMFRAWTQSHAANLGLRGWVRNLADGKVEVLAQGAPEKLNELKKLLLTGSPFSRVERVETNWIDDEKIDDSFHIR